MTVTIDTVKLEKKLTRLTKKWDETWTEILFASNKEEEKELMEYERKLHRCILEMSRTIALIGLEWDEKTMTLKEAK